MICPHLSIDFSPDVSHLREVLLRFQIVIQSVSKYLVFSFWIKPFNFQFYQAEIIIEGSAYLCAPVLLVHICLGPPSPRLRERADSSYRENHIEIVRTFYSVG